VLNKVLGLSLIALSSVFSKTFILSPGADGKDALIFSRMDTKDKNYRDAAQFMAQTWTWNADNLGQGSYRSLIEFDLKDIPVTATINSAKLYLYCDTLNYTKGHSSLSANDASSLQRVAAAWEESTVTWNNQPATDTAGQVILAKSDSAKQNYVVDVGALVAAMVAEPSKNHGFMLRSLSETPYNNLGFASGDNADTTLRPKLTIEYEEEIATRIGDAAARNGIAGISIARTSAMGLTLSRPVTGEVLDMRGDIRTRLIDARTISLGGLGRGAYLLRTQGRAIRFVVQ
jgi:hypothetical protein